MGIDLKKIIDLDEIKGELEATAKVWLAQNKEAFKDLPKEAIQAAAALAIIATLGAKVTDPSLNIRKMEAAATIAEVAADQQERLKAAEASLKKLLGDVAKGIMARIGKAALATVIALV